MAKYDNNPSLNLNDQNYNYNQNITYFLSCYLFLF